MKRATLNTKLRGRAPLLIAAAITLGAIAACSSDGGNAQPSTPVITTGGTGGKSGSSAGSSAGGSSAGTSAGGTSAGGTAAHGGSSSTAGKGGDTETAGDGNTGGEAGDGTGGTGPIKNCPTTDEGFLNQVSKSQSSPFDNTARLGAHATLPPLPGS